jgi:AraC-like DNA-binding protein
MGPRVQNCSHAVKPCDGPTREPRSEVYFAQMDPRIDYVTSFIRKNYHQKMTLAEMSAAVNLSPWRLCHLFTEIMKTSPQRFLTQVRLEQARKLLGTEFLTVKEVMNQVGISDASSFARSFKAAYGVTPSQYRVAASIDKSSKRKSNRS